MVRARERGEGKTGCFIGVILLLIAVVIAMKFIPQRIAVSELQDFVVKQAESASLVREKDGKTPEQIIADNILAKANELRLPLTREALKVQVDQARILVIAKYSLDVNLLVTTYTWNIDINVDRMLF